MDIEQFFPDSAILNACRRFENALFVKFVPARPEEFKQDPVVDQCGRGVSAIDLSRASSWSFAPEDAGSALHSDSYEAEKSFTSSSVSAHGIRLNLIAGRKSQSIGGKRTVPGNHAASSRLWVFDDIGGLRHYKERYCGTFRCSGRCAVGACSQGHVPAIAPLDVLVLNTRYSA